jgi:hypothetical protein
MKIHSKACSAYGRRFLAIFYDMSKCPLTCANQYLHIDQINFIKTRIKFCKETNRV